MNILIIEAGTIARHRAILKNEEFSVVLAMAESDDLVRAVASVQKDADVDAILTPGGDRVMTPHSRSQPNKIAVIKEARKHWF